MPSRALKKKSVVTDPVEPAVTPPPKSPETTFLTKPKLSPKSRKRDMPEGLWIRCPECEELIYDKELDEKLAVLRDEVSRGKPSTLFFNAVKVCAGIAVLAAAVSLFMFPLLATVAFFLLRGVNQRNREMA